MLEVERIPAGLFLEELGVFADQLARLVPGQRRQFGPRQHPGSVRALERGGQTRWQLAEPCRYRDQHASCGRTVQQSAEQIG